MKRLSTVLLTMMATLSFGQLKEQYTKIADSLKVLGKSDELIDYFSRELKTHPKDETVLRILGHAYLAQHNLDLGEQYYKEALLVNPKCSDCYLNIAVAYAFRDDIAKALEYNSKAIEVNPNKIENYLARAELYIAHGSFAEAASSYDKAIALEPNNSLVYAKRGLYNINMGKPIAALSDLEKAITLDPNNAEAYAFRGNIYYTQKRLKDALKDFSKAIELDGNNAEFYFNRASVLATMKDYTKGIEDYTKSIALDKSAYQPYQQRAYAFAALEDLDGACADFAILKSFAERGEITDKNLLAEINEANRNTCDASKPSYYYQRGIGYYNLGQYQRAVDKYTEGLKVFPESALMISFKGNAYLSLGEYEKAIECYNLSLLKKDNIITEEKIFSAYENGSEAKLTEFLNMTLASTYYSLAECKLNLGRYDEAIVDLNEAIKIGPDIKEANKETYYNMRGYIYMIQEKYALATSDFNTSIQINSRFPLAYVNRAIAQVCVINKVKSHNYSISLGFSKQPMSINWVTPTKAILKKSKSDFLSALYDCNKAIELDGKLAYGYYIRGQIKQMLEYGDYCYDLAYAKEQGLILEPSLLQDCGL